MHFLVKNKIPRLHSGVSNAASNAARFLSQSLRFNSFLLRIRYTKLQNCSFETARAQRAIHNYLNKSFVNDKLLKVLVKYHSINNSIATRERRIDRPQKPSKGTIQRRPCAIVFLPYSKLLPIYGIVRKWKENRKLFTFLKDAIDLRKHGIKNEIQQFIIILFNDKYDRRSKLKNKI